jgi:hypothetical protein
MARTLVTRLVLAALALLVVSCGGPTDAQRLRMSGVHVEAPQDPQDPVPPAGAETRFLPRHHTAGDTYRRVDETSVEVGEHSTVVRVERTVTIDEIDREGIISLSEKITAYARTVDGRNAPLTREQRDLEAATIRYRLTEVGEPVGELEVIDEGRFNGALLRALAQISITQDALDRTLDMAVGAQRSADNVVDTELASDARADLRLHMNYTLAERSEREARLDIEGTAEMPETTVGRNKVRGTGNISGRWTIDPRDGFAGTRNVELRLYAMRRDAGNRPVGENTTYIVRWQTNISKR